MDRYERKTSVQKSLPAPTRTPPATAASAAKTSTPGAPNVRMPALFVAEAPAVPLAMLVSTVPILVYGARVLEERTSPLSRKRRSARRPLLLSAWGDARIARLEDDRRRRGDRRIRVCDGRGGGEGADQAGRRVGGGVCENRVVRRGGGRDGLQEGRRCRFALVRVCRRARRAVSRAEDQFGGERAGDQGETHRRAVAWARRSARVRQQHRERVRAPAAAASCPFVSVARGGGRGRAPQGGRSN